MEAVKGEITPGTAVMTIAVWVDEVRLIDNEIL
jgi:pantothenate synthetase